MLTLLSLALLIQMLYYIIHDAHYVIILFIIMSLSLLKFSKNENTFILIPMLVSHAIYVFLPKPSYEGFKKKKKFNLKKPNLKKKFGKLGKLVKKTFKKTFAAKSECRKKTKQYQDKLKLISSLTLP